jgi:xanthine dehydrogenase accessory factor
MSLTQNQLRSLLKQVQNSQRAVLITVIEVKGSAPRGVGTAMAVLQNDIVGTIGGGRLEYEACALALQTLASDKFVAFTRRYALGDSLGQCCGGSVLILFEHIDEADEVWITQALDNLRSGSNYQRQVDDWYQHTFTPNQARLVLCGAGHVGKALVHVLENVPIDVHWVDERAEQFPSQVTSNVHCEVTDTADVVIKNAPANSAVLITTHRHDLDFLLAETALARQDLAYVGMIGSRSKRARFERSMQHRHGDAVNTERLVCPIGEGGASGKEPAVLVVGVANELLKAVLY